MHSIVVVVDDSAVLMVYLLVIRSKHYGIDYEVNEIKHGKNVYRRER